MAWDQKEITAYLVDVDTGDYLDFQYNPNDIVDEKSTAYAAIKIPGMSHPRYQYVAGEPRKHGFALEEVSEAVRRIAIMPALALRGLMTIAPLATDAQTARPIFRRLRELRDDLRAQWPGLDELSMGMSDDFEVAIEEGATLIRVGRAIFGERPLQPST
mgnify:CR=1 FL=1